MIQKVDANFSGQTCGLRACRLAKQRFREARVQFQDYIILLMAGACLGPLSNMKDTTLGTGGYFYTLIALGMPSSRALCHTFHETISIVYFFI